MDTNKEFERTDGRRFLLRFRIPTQVKVLFSIVLIFAWIGGSLYWIAFLGRSFGFFQNVALLLVAFIVFCASNAILWAIDQVRSL